MAKVESGVALASRAKYGFRTRQVESFISNVAATLAQIVAPNPDRIHLTIILQSQGPVYIAHTAEAANNGGGYLLGSFGDGLSYSIDIDGEAVGYEQWMYSTLTSRWFFIVETIKTQEA